MKIVMVSFDRNVFREGDSTRARIAGYGEVFDELHIIVYAKKTLGLTPQKIAQNVWLYPTNSFTKLFYISDAVRIAKNIIRETSVDVVSGQDLGETGIAAWLIARTHRLPLQLQDHADVLNDWFVRAKLSNRVRVLVARFLIPKATSLRVVLPEAKERILARYPTLKKRIAVLPVFTDTKALIEATPSFDLHERYPRFKTIMLIASRLVPEKNIEFSLLAFKKAAIPDSGLIIVGEGSSITSLSAESTRLGLDEQVVFVPWEKDLVPYYKTADLFLLSSSSESYCRALVEAAAVGLPFVSTNVGIASALVEGGAQGTVLKQGDLEGFSEAIREHVTSGKRSSINRGSAMIDGLAGSTEEEYRIRFRSLFDACLPPLSV